MEAILSSQSVDTDVLPPNLEYPLDPAGSFVIASRGSCSYALGSSYSPITNRMISVPFGSTTEWLVPESLLFSANFHNLDNVNLAWLATPDANCLFERIDIRLSGQLVESITESNRINEMFTRLTMSPQKKANLSELGYGTQSSDSTNQWFSAQNHVAGIVGHGETKQIHWKCVVRGLLNQHRWLPLYSMSGNGLSVQPFLAPVAESLIRKVGTTTYSQS